LHQAISTNKHLNPEMERVLVEGTVKEARFGTIRMFEPIQKRDRVSEAKTLVMKGFHWFNT